MRCLPDQPPEPSADDWLWDFLSWLFGGPTDEADRAHEDEDDRSDGAARC